MRNERQKINRVAQENRSQVFKPPANADFQKLVSHLPSVPLRHRAHRLRAARHPARPLPKTLTIPHTCHPEPGRLPLANGGEGSALSPVILERTASRLCNILRVPSRKHSLYCTLVITNPVACLWRTAVRDLLLLFRFRFLSRSRHRRAMSSSRADPVGPKDLSARVLSSPAERTGSPCAHSV